MPVSSTFKFFFKFLPLASLGSVNSRSGTAPWTARWTPLQVPVVWPGVGPGSLRSGCGTTSDRLSLVHHVPMGHGPRFDSGRLPLAVAGEKTTADPRADYAGVCASLPQFEISSRTLLANRPGPRSPRAVTVSCQRHPRPPGLEGLLWGQSLVCTPPCCAGHGVCQCCGPGTT